jgi:hypothetical protein
MDSNKDLKISWNEIQALRPSLNWGLFEILFVLFANKEKKSVRTILGTILDNHFLKNVDCKIDLDLEIIELLERHTKVLSKDDPMDSASFRCLYKNKSLSIDHPGCILIKFDK